MKKRLLHLQRLSILSGVQKFSLLLLDGLDPDEYEIYVACIPGDRFEEEVRKRGWKFIPVPVFSRSISLADLYTFFQLLVIFRTYRFDIVHTNSSKPGILGRLAAKVTGVPKIIHTAHGTAFQEDQNICLKTIYKLFERCGNALSNAVVFVNNTDRERCLNLGIVKPEIAHTIYNAIPKNEDIHFPIPQPKSAQDAEVVFGSTIRFSDQKNVISLVKAACKACLKSHKIKFIILGDGEHYSLCKSIVKSFMLEERVLLPGWETDVTKWLPLFDAFVLYSRWEAMPFSIIEAMEFGLPIIGSDIPSIRELVTNDVGYLVPLDKESALIDLFCELAHDPTQLVNKGKEANIRISNLCDYASMIRAYRQIYEG